MIKYFPRSGETFMVKYYKGFILLTCQKIQFQGLSLDFFEIFRLFIIGAICQALHYVLN